MTEEELLKIPNLAALLEKGIESGHFDVWRTGSRVAR